MTAVPPALPAEDVLAIRELTYRYSLHLGLYQLEPLMQLWTDDAVFDERQLGLKYAVGKPAIRAFFEHDFTVTDAHVLYNANHLIEANGADQANGTLLTYVQADLKSGDTIKVTVSYDDTYRKQNGHWLFASRVMRPMCKVDLSGMAKALGTASAQPATVSVHV